jgi:hypothetical protein
MKERLHNIIAWFGFVMGLIAIWFGSSLVLDEWRYEKPITYVQLDCAVEQSAELLVTMHQKGIEKLRKVHEEWAEDKDLTLSKSSWWDTPIPKTPCEEDEQGITNFQRTDLVAYKGELHPIVVGTRQGYNNGEIPDYYYRMTIGKRDDAEDFAVRGGIGWLICTIAGYLFFADPRLLPWRRR